MSQTKRRKPLSESVKASLKKKAEGTKFFYGELAEVYRKGQGAYLSAGSRNVPMAAWAMGRVNSYMSGKVEQERQTLKFIQNIKRKGNGSTNKKTKRNIKSSFSASYKKAHELYDTKNA